MKKIVAFVSPVVVLGLALSACSDSKGRYLDLSTGQKVEIEKDEKGVVINKETKQPLYIYVDTKKNDTIYAATGEVINGHVVKLDDSSYIYDKDQDVKVKLEDGEYKRKDGDFKVKVEDDGDIKIKDGDKKIKIDDGEKTIKND